jgi:hypothetical protein
MQQAARAYDVTIKLRHLDIHALGNISHCPLQAD